MCCPQRLPLLRHQSAPLTMRLYAASQQPAGVACDGHFEGPGLWAEGLGNSFAAGGQNDRSTGQGLHQCRVFC